MIDKDEFNYYFSEFFMDNSLQKLKEVREKARMQRNNSNKNLYAIGNNSDVYKRRKKFIGTRRRRGKGIKVFKEENNSILESFLSQKNPEQIYLVSDMHFFKNENKNLNKISTKKLMENFKNQCKIKLKNGDVLIILGDIGYKKNSPKQNEEIKDFFKSIKCDKILIKGNHDTLSDQYYKECGFLFVTNYLMYDNIIMTHFPADIEKYRLNGIKYNIHGHLHGVNDYWDVDGKNHFDVFNKHHFLLNLKDVNKILTKEKVYTI